MGIQGLIPFLEKSSRPINISQFAGCTVAIDAYCWLHKGAFSCADKLARGDKTDAYVTYCMKYVNMLLSHNIKPILVFDGRHLPAKSETEKKRRQNRELNKRRAAELLRMDKPNEARTYLQRCVDVTHAMAVELMRECRSRNVDCITAPYEADAQLAFLNLSNIAHIVITEDSDLLLFGCTKVVFKLDLNGNGLLVDQDRLHLAMGVSKGCFSLDRFRHMCILSGCDYLASLPKIGLAKACRFIKSTVDPDIHRALSRLGGHLNMSISVPLEYRDKFVEAEAMFRHQPVYDPLTRRIVPLTPASTGTSLPPLLSQETLTPEQQLQLALGNLDPFTLKKVDDWSPEMAQQTVARRKSWNANVIAPHKSMWSADFKPKPLVIEEPDLCKVQHTSTAGKVVERKVEVKLPAKRPLPSKEEELNALRLQFGSCPNPPSKKPRHNEEEELFDSLDIVEKSDKTPPKPQTVDLDLLESPKKAAANPFTKTTPPSTNKFSGLSKLAQFRKTSVSDTKIMQSRYFGGNVKSEPTSQPPDENKPNQSLVKHEDNQSSSKTLKDVSNVMENHLQSYDKTRPEKLTDSGIFTEVSKEDDVHREKENVTDKSKPERSFKWRPSLEDMYGFKNKVFSSSTAVRKDFVNPSKSQETFDRKSGNFRSSPKKEETSTSKPVSRNPFAKVIKVEEVTKTREPEDTPLDVLTPDSALSEESGTSTSPASVTTKPHMKVGLSKRTSGGSGSGGGCQKSLLSMFAFTPKRKLQH